MILWPKMKLDIVQWTSCIIVTNTKTFIKQILIMKLWEIQNRKETNTAILVIFLLMDSSWEQVESSADSSQSPRPHICIILHSQPLIGFFVEKNIYFFSFSSSSILGPVSQINLMLWIISWNIMLQGTNKGCFVFK